MSQPRVQPAPAPTYPTAPGPQATRARGSHAHLWTAPDGTGLHAPYARLVVEADSGRVCCHLCGRWFVSLGSHVRRHGHSAATYRTAMGLCRSRALSSTSLSATISRRQRAAYRADAALRAQLAPGQALARSGQLAARGRAVPTAEQVAVQSAGLDRGRRRRAERSAARLVDVPTAAGDADLASYLRRRYAEGASLATLADDLGLGRDRLRAAISDAGLVPRPPGATTAAGRASRAVVADRAAAALVGTDDLRGWLLARREDGWSLHRLGQAVGHSGAWVGWRLADQVPAAAGD